MKHPKPRLHGWCTSPFCQKVVLVFEHKGIDYDWVPAPLLQRGQLTRASGSDKVPVLQLGDRWIVDSTAIAAWAEQHHPEPALMPTDSHRASLCALLEDWADESLTFHAHAAYWCPPGNARRLLATAVVDRPTFETRFGAWAFGRIAPGMFRKLATLRRDEAGSRQLLGEQLDLVEGLLSSGPCLLGDAPTFADFAVGAQLINLVALEREAYFAGRPALARWIDGIVERLPARHRIQAHELTAAGSAATAA